MRDETVAKVIGTAKGKPGYTIEEAIKTHPDLPTARLRASVVIAEDFDHPGELHVTTSGVDERFKAYLMEALRVIIAQPPPVSSQQRKSEK